MQEKYESNLPPEREKLEEKSKKTEVGYYLRVWMYLTMILRKFLF